MLSVLASGTLTRDPMECTSAAGKPYATALLRVPCEDADALHCSLIAFAPDVVRALMALAKGDSLAVAGRAKGVNRDEEQGQGTKRPSNRGAALRPAAPLFD